MLIRKQLREVQEVYKLIKSRAKKFVENVDLVTAKEFEFEGENSELLIWRKSEGGSNHVSNISDTTCSG